MPVLSVHEQMVGPLPVKFDSIRDGNLVHGHSHCPRTHRRQCVGNVCRENNARKGLGAMLETHSLSEQEIALSHLESLHQSIPSHYLHPQIHTEDLPC